ncbi:hypothetical protein L2V94_22710, partial [Escherichia coli]|uniref:hypothetical protein n=1 Tax=Escherichia coli TaxID=562 RepID=UPI001F2EBAC0
RVHKGVHNKNRYYRNTSNDKPLMHILNEQIQTRNANSYFSAFTNAAHSNRAAFFFPATSILFCVPAPDFAMFFCPAH